MKILLLTRYDRLGASSRLRYYQYLPYLTAQGISVETAALFDDRYVRDLAEGRRRSRLAILSAYVNRIRQLLKIRYYDLVWVEYEVLPWLPYWIERLFLNGEVPYVVEYDDAIFHRYDMHASNWVRRLLGGKIDALMRHSNTVIVGNDYLADRARHAGASRVAYLPTAVDLDRYVSRKKQPTCDFVVGWVGSPATVLYLDLLKPALTRLAKTVPLKLVVVGAQAPRWDGLNCLSMPWSEEGEVAQISNFDVGVMPLPDDLWTRGKCGYKLIQYMACGKPVVASPVGVNADIVEPGVNGFLANSVDDWVSALDSLRSDKDLGPTLGQAGRNKVESEFCIQVTAPKLEAILRQAVNG